MTYIGKSVYFNVLDDIIRNYNNISHSSIKIKPKDVSDNSFVENVEESNKKDPKFKLGDNVREEVHKYNYKKYSYKRSTEYSPLYLINDLNDEKIVGSFYEKELQKTDKKEFRIEKVIKKKGDKLYVKWKGYDNSFNSWIYRKDLL